MTVAEMPQDPTTTATTAQMPIPPRTITLSQIRSAIPSHCFQRSLLHSLRYLFTDLFLILTLFTFTRLLHPHLSQPFTTLLWLNYWWWQGAIATGVWVLAHECGHQSFSPWKSVNDFFGLILHSLLLVPYHSWRITHGIHHRRTNHMQGDQVFVPAKVETVEGMMMERGKERRWEVLWESLCESPIGELGGVIRMLTLGWPAYLMVNAAGQSYEGTDKRKLNHFHPKAPMFKDHEFWDVVLSDVGLGVVISGLVLCGKWFGWRNLMFYYGVPYLLVNMWLVLITYLQHSDPRIPHYHEKEWTFIRGALCSVDRDYGIYNVLHHHIGDTHVAHHLFSKMPFYHAQEATECIKKVLGKYYMSDRTPIVRALFRSWRECKFVDESDGPVMFFKNRKMVLEKKVA